MKPERRYITNWEKQLSASEPDNNNNNNSNSTSSGNNSISNNHNNFNNAPTINGLRQIKSQNQHGSSKSIDPKLNGWLQNIPQNNNGTTFEQPSESIINALWSLRNFMMKDALDLASL